MTYIFVIPVVAKFPDSRVVRVISLLVDLDWLNEVLVASDMSVQVVAIDADADVVVDVSLADVFDAVDVSVVAAWVDLVFVGIVVGNTFDAAVAIAVSLVAKIVDRLVDVG